MPATAFSGMVDKMFHNNLNRLFDDDFWGFSGVSRNVNVPVNLQETDKSYEMEVVAPGLKKEDFKVNVSDDMLTVSFEHQQQQDHQKEDGSWLRREYHKQSFTRTFSLNDTVDAGKISAKYTDGILHLSMPKKPSAQTVTQSIEIK